VCSGKQFHVFDSFEGLPQLQGQDLKDGIYDKGSITSGLDEFFKNFCDVGLDLAHLHKGWFEDTIPSCLPDQISFAVVDCQLYASTKHVLPHLYERLVPGAICLIYVYYDEKVFPRLYTTGAFKSPGVKQACDEFFYDMPDKVSVLLRASIPTAMFACWRDQTVLGGSSSGGLLSLNSAFKQAFERIFRINRMGYREFGLA